LTQTHLRH
jgi:hypothetical protein